MGKKKSSMDFRPRPESIIPHEIETVGEALSLWEGWCRRFMALPQVTMSEEQSKILAILAIQEAAGAPLMEEVGASFFYNVLDKRLKAFNVEASPQLKTFVCSMCDNPADVVMYTHILIWMHLNTKKPVDFMTFVEAFARGFPAEESLFDIWYMQKRKVDEPGVLDNFLDQITPQVIGCYEDWKSTLAEPA